MYKANADESWWSLNRIELERPYTHKAEKAGDCVDHRTAKQSMKDIASKDIASIYRYTII